MCHLVSSFSPIVGGAERAVQTLCHALTPLGVTSTVLTRQYPGLPRTDDMGGSVVLRAGVPDRSKLGAMFYGIHALWLLYVRRRATDAVHVHNVDAPLLVGFLAKLLFAKPILMTVHGEANVAVKRETFAGRLRLALMVRMVDGFVALTDAARVELIAAGASPDRIDMIPNPIDIEYFRPPTSRERADARRGLELPGTDFVCLFVGRLDPVKRVDLLIRAWGGGIGESHRPAQLLVVGDGPESERLTSLAKELASRTLRFEGSSNDILRYLHAADLFVLPSDSEGLPMALLEAMCAGLCCVVSGLPGYRGLIEHGRTGLIFDKGDCPGLRACLEQATRDPLLTSEIGRSARRRCAGMVSAKTVAVSHAALYRELTTLLEPGP